MRTRVLLVVLAFLAAPLMAQSNDVAVWAGDSRVGSTDVSGTSIHFNRGHSYGASLNRFFGDHLSAELAAFSVRHNGNIQIGGVNALSTGRLRMTPITLTLQTHLARASKFDVYAGAGGAYVRTSNLHSSDLDSAGVGTVNVKSKVTWTVLGGISYGFIRQLAISADARYIGYKPDSGPSNAIVKLKLNPVLYSAGLRFRF